MAARRIIPTMLVRGRTLVKGERFDSWRSIGHALQAAQVHARRQVDELLILDIAATAESRGPDLDLVRELSAGCFVPITVGGGVRSLQDIDALLRAGADKVAICTHATEDLLRNASSRFGCQAIVVVIEHEDPRFDVAEAVQRACAFGAGEVVLQSVQRDGTMQGYDLKAIRTAAEFCSVPLIASGGCSGYSDMLAAFKAGADACAAGALFSFTDSTPKGAAQFLRQQGMEVRL